VSEAIALLKVPFFIVPTTEDTGADEATGSGFSLRVLCLTGEVGTGNFLYGDDAMAMAVCGRWRGIDFAGDLLTIVVFSLLVLSAEALLGRSGRRIEAGRCKVDVVAESRCALVGAVAGLLMVPLLFGRVDCWVAVPRGLGSGGGDFVC
jgi:hypothetical protein